MKKILFITKNFPPQKWWMENYSKDLYENLKKYTKVYLIANWRWKYFLPIFWIIVLFKWIYLARKVDIIYIWDGSISFIGYFLWKLFKKEIYITIHWLDITWQNKLYQKFIPNIIKKFDKIVAVSSNTKQICIDKWSSKEKIKVIYNWLHFEQLPKIDENLNKKEVLKEYWINDFEWKKILFTVWRFVERKWIHNFLENVFSKLDKEKYIYILGWFWKYEEKYKEIIKKYNLENVYLIWKLWMDKISKLEIISDLFIMPNIKVNWDIEWFWITVIEAWYYWLPVVWSNIEWLKDSVINWKTGILIDDDENRDKKWLEVIKNFDYKEFNRQKIKQEVTNNFSWDIIIKKYLELIK
jgi:phosphatidylinositol alpha-1,6-mannosyltransferase